MQSKLGPLTDGIRRVRAHITSLIPCDSGLPVTVDEILFAIARGELDRASFRNGCLWTAMAPRMKTSQPRQAESVRTIGAVLNAYLAGESRADVTKSHPEASSATVAEAPKAQIPGAEGELDAATVRHEEAALGNNRGSA
jgi:hypothetical protein